MKEQMALTWIGSFSYGVAIIIGVYMGFHEYTIEGCIGALFLCGVTYFCWGNPVLIPNTTKEETNE